MGQWMDQMTRGCPPAFYDRLSRGLCPRAPLMTLPSPSLRRLFSTSQRRAAPCSAGLRAAPAGCRGARGALGGSKESGVSVPPAEGAGEGAAGVGA